MAQATLAQETDCCPSAAIRTSRTMFSDLAAPMVVEAVAKKPRQEDRQTCLPVTVRAIERAVEQRADTGGELRFHGSEPGVLLLVGLVEAMTKQAASIEFSLNDGTGRIKARHYVSDRQSSNLDALAPGCYVSAFGSVRTAPEVHLAVVGMGLVQSADEVSYHMIEAAYAALRLQKVRVDPVTPSPKKLSDAPAELSPQKAEKPAAAAEPSACAAPVKEQLSGSALRKELLRFIQKEGDGKPEGVSFPAVCNHVSSTPADEVSRALEKLVDAGEIFTTIDDGHFQCL
uniref:Replication protein A C-terminal domain-containing protein n=1 Tax=Alexandrium monilatum TaxID=311494 RepID=A0A7S4SVV3_9DINO